MCCDGDGDVMLTTGAYRAGTWLYVSHMHVYMVHDAHDRCL